MPAAQTLIAMAAECRRAATDDGVHHLAVLKRKMRSIAFDEAAARGAKDVGHLEGGTAHRLARLLECLAAVVSETSIASSGLATPCR